MCAVVLLFCSSLNFTGCASLLSLCSYRPPPTKGTVAYRTSNPGHEGCEGLKQEPLPAVNEALYAPFNWRIFGQLDNIVAEELRLAQSHEKPGAPARFLVLNTSAMSGLRPDGRCWFHFAGREPSVHEALLKFLCAQRIAPKDPQQ